MTLSCKYDYNFNVSEVFACFSLQLLLPGNGQPQCLGTSHCWLLGVCISDALKAQWGKESNTQLVLLEVYSQFGESSPLDFTQLFTYLILSSCLIILLTWSYTMIGTALLSFCFTKKHLWSQALLHWCDCVQIRVKKHRNCMQNCPKYID